MRGEHARVGALLKPNNGSSPHARGTPRYPESARALCRFIPACAGNTHARLFDLVSEPVHPRMRGEHNPCCSFAMRATGSSPHARGTRAAGVGAGGARRFIPACAGNTQRKTSMVRQSAVHPRMRGEHRAYIPDVILSAGSSPHARGTRPGTRGDPARPRFIPACAGNTECSQPAAAIRTVHPRMRGEHVTMTMRQAVNPGSSPHARGTHAWAASGAQSHRFIPACAGNTCGGRRQSG